MGMGTVIPLAKRRKRKERRGGLLLSSESPSPFQLEKVFVSLDIKTGCFEISSPGDPSRLAIRGGEGGQQQSEGRNRREVKNVSLGFFWGGRLLKRSDDDCGRDAKIPASVLSE